MSTEQTTTSKAHTDTWMGLDVDGKPIQISSGRSLTKKQAEKLDEIWERATARG